MGSAIRDRQREEGYTTTETISHYTPPGTPSITGDWLLDQELLGIARVAVDILTDRQPDYRDYRTLREAEDA